ncbi:phage adaptor protein [Brucella sp. C7-11G]
MAFSNYLQLQETIADYILRPDAPIKSFIALAENDVSVFVRHYMQEKEVRLTSSGNEVSLPDDFQEARRIVVDGTLATPISAYNGKPKAGEIGYYQRGNSYVIVPETNEPRSVSLLYFARVPILSDQANTNWLLERFPSILFHASMARAYRWLKDPTAEAQEKASLGEAFGTLTADHNRAITSGNQPTIDFGGGW